MIPWFAHIVSRGSNTGSMSDGSGSNTGCGSGIGGGIDNMHSLCKFDGTGSGDSKGAGIGMGFGCGYGTNAFLGNSPEYEFGSGEINWWELVG